MIVARRSASRTYDAECRTTLRPPELKLWQSTKRYFVLICFITASSSGRKPSSGLMA